MQLFQNSIFHALEHRTVALLLAWSLVEVGEQPVCLGTRGLRLNLEALRGAAGWDRQARDVANFDFYYDTVETTLILSHSSIVTETWGGSVV